MSNKNVKRTLIERYGEKCFIEILHLRIDTTPRRYKSKSQMRKMKQITYHHIKMKKDGGNATVENGALLSRENHQWFHQQSEQAQDYMNNLFQEYKRRFDECEVVYVDDLQLPFEVRAVEFTIDEKGRFNRAKEKRETKRLINEYYDELEK